MTRNDPQLFRCHLQMSRDDVNHVRVADAVETVATNAESLA